MAEEPKTEEPAQAAPEVGADGRARYGLAVRERNIALLVSLCKPLDFMCSRCLTFALQSLRLAAGGSPCDRGSA